MSILGKINIDFFVFTLYDPKLLVIADNSNWLHIVDKPSVIEILVPGSTTPRLFNFLKNGSNSFNSHNLCLSCLTADCTEEEYVNLPDGVYTITLKGSPSTYTETKYFLKTDSMQQRLDKLLIDSGFSLVSGDKKLRDRILDINILRQTSEAYVRRGEINEARKFFKITLDELTKLENCN